MEQAVSSAPYIISNVLAIAITITAMIWPTVARAVLSVIFIAAFGFNLMTAILNPSLYLEFGELTPNEFYRSIILGPFSHHVRVYIILIAICQLFIGVFTSYTGRLMKIAMAGGVLFLLAIAPLGFGAAFPSSLILATSYVILFFKRIQFNVAEVASSKF